MDWIWDQPVGRWKVQTSRRDGTVRVQDEKGRILLERENMSEAAVKMIEENFLNIVANEKKPHQDLMFQ